MNNTGYVAELFPSIQGEGLWVGQHQLFLRLAGCSYQCNYCDTSWAQKKELDQASICFLPITKSNTKLSNPVSATDLSRLIERLWTQLGPFESLAITGGEPLEQPDFLISVLKAIDKSKLPIKIMLETNGVHTEKLSSVLPYIHSISMDLKLKSATGINMPAKKHSRFLNLIKHKSACVKLVISPKTTSREIIMAAKMIHASAPKLEMILQPVMKKTIKTKLPISTAYKLMKVAMRYHQHVRVIPQMHKYAGIA